MIDFEIEMVRWGNIHWRGYINIFIICNAQKHEEENHVSKGKAPYQRRTPLPSLVFGKIFSIELTLSTWLKDSHGLYDYEAPDTKCERETIPISRSSNIYRNVLSISKLTQT